VLEHGFSRKDDHENKAKQMKDALKQAAKENEDGIKWGGKLSAADINFQHEINGVYTL
jgi:hypothetical protein